jgi:hypothetical protein
MKKDIEAYLRAIEIEADSEAIYYKDFGVTGAATQIPRVLRVLGKIKQNQTSVNFILPIVRWFYALIFAPFLLLYRALNVGLKLQEDRSNCTEIQPRKTIYLATSSGSNLAFLTPSSSIPDLIITNPFRGGIRADIVPDLQRVSILGFVTLSDLAGAWCRAVIANWCLLRMNDGRNILWGYTALEWYVIYRVLMRLKPEAIWISNHHDRWLILALSIPDVSVSLVQHGRLFHILPSGNQISYKRKSKIMGLTSIYAIDSLSENFFSDYIDTHGVTFYRLTVTLSLMPWRSEEQGHLKILVIGGSDRLDFYLALMDAIRAALVPPVALAIRHHPLQKKRLSDLRFSVDYWELSSDEPAPEPNLVVTYGSSIDDQISNATQAPIITYDWSDQIDIKRIVQRVQFAAIGLRKD